MLGARLRYVRRIVLALTVVITAAVVALTLNDEQASATPSSTLVINEVYGGGGNSGATLHQRLHRAGEPQRRGGQRRRLVGAVPLGGATGSWQVTTLTGSIPRAAALYLVGESKGAGGTQAAAPTQASGSIAMSATAGHRRARTRYRSADLRGLGLVRRARRRTWSATAPRRSARPRRRPARLTPSPSSAATSPTPTTTRPTSAPAPRPRLPPTVPAAATEAARAPASPVRCASTTSRAPAGSRRTTATRSPTCPGIVTAIRSSGSSKGYWIQDPDPDYDPATSEGIFVFTSSPGVAVGDSVLVSGTVKDFYPLASGETVSTTSQLSVTEIDSPTAIVLSHGNALPAPEVIAPTDGSRHVRPGPRRRQHRVDPDHA